MCGGLLPAPAVKTGRHHRRRLVARQVSPRRPPTVGHARYWNAYRRHRQDRGALRPVLGSVVSAERNLLAPAEGFRLPSLPGFVSCTGPKATASTSGRVEFVILVAARCQPSQHAVQCIRSTHPSLGCIRFAASWPRWSRKPRRESRTVRRGFVAPEVGLGGRTSPENGGTQAAPASTVTR